MAGKAHGIEADAVPVLCRAVDHHHPVACQQQVVGGQLAVIVVLDMLQQRQVLGL